jgi:hypothetical protein
MKYFKTPERLNGKRVILDAKKGLYFEFVANELFTARELERMHLSANAFEVVEIPWNRVYFSFGVRFSF